MEKAEEILWSIINQWKDWEDWEISRNPWEHRKSYEIWKSLEILQGGEISGSHLDQGSQWKSFGAWKIS